MEVGWFMARGEIVGLGWRALASLRVMMALAWLAFITIAYVVATHYPVRYDAFRGARQAWPFLAIIVVAAGAAFLVGAWGSERARRWCSALLVTASGGLALAVTVMGQHGIAVAVALWLALVAWTAGDRLLSLLVGTEGRAPPLDRVPFAVGLSFGLFSHGMLGLALLGLVHFWLVVVILAALTLLLWRDVLATFRALTGRTRRWLIVDRPPGMVGLPLMALMAGWGLLILIQTLAPETQYDAVSYHLALPRLYIEQQRFVLTPENIQSWFYLGMDMNFLLAMLLGGQIAAKLLNLVFLALNALIVFVAGRRFFSARAGLLAAVLYVATPITAWNSTTAYTDVPLATFGLLAAVATYLWLEERRAGWLAVAGLMGGFAISVKLNAGLMLAGIGLVALVALVARRQLAWGRLWRSGAAFTAAFVASVFPWPALRFARTGNPVYPFAKNIFPESEAMVQVSSGAGAVTGPVLEYSRTGSILELPWTMTFDASRFSGDLPHSALGLGLLGLLLLAFVRPFSRHALFFGGVLLLFLITWVMTWPLPRYISPGLPLIYLLVGYALASLATDVGDWRRPLDAGLRLVVVAWVALGLPSFLASYWMIPERVPARVAFGLESQDAYLARVLPAYGAYQHVNQQAANEPVYLLALSRDELWLYGPARTITEQSPSARPILNSTTPDQTLERLDAAGVTHLLINWFALWPWIESHPIADPEFLARNTWPAYVDDDVTVYRIRPPAERLAAGAPLPQLMPNPGFEKGATGALEHWTPYGQPRHDGSGERARTGLGAVWATAGSGYEWTVPVAPGEIYLLRLHARTDAPGSSVRLQINWHDASNHLLDATIRVVPATGEWTSYEALFRAPAGARAAQAHATAHTGEVWIDDLTVHAYGRPAPRADSQAGGR